MNLIKSIWQRSGVLRVRPHLLLAGVGVVAALGVAFPLSSALAAPQPSVKPCYQVQAEPGTPQFREQSAEWDRCAARWEEVRQAQIEDEQTRARQGGEAIEQWQYEHRYGPVPNEDDPYFAHNDAVYEGRDR